MAFNPTAKAYEMGAELASKLNQRTNGAQAVVFSLDTDGCALITLGDGTAGNKNAVIKVCAYPDGLSKDSLGLSAGDYGPEVVMIATEANYAGTNDNIADILDPQTLLNVLGLAFATGCRVEWWVSANGTAPTSATFNTGSNLKGSYWPSQKWAQTQAQ